MPAPTHLLPHVETLANGLRVSLRHAPGLKRCAAALRVAAGSHDAPLAWPGLAHFLEHLFFLGTERFPADDGLMAYVQRHGGQLNASTRERTTDFFFELPPQDFAGGLERLCDMLAHPRLNPDDQLREREVLEAEFIAWSQDVEAQRHLALFEGLSPDHPLRGFHAGNRDSLAVQQPEFQQALSAFYQRFYQTGQITLSLAGPQSVDELRSLAERLSGDFAVGKQQPQSAPPALMATANNSYQQADERRLNLLFAFEALPNASREALDFLCTWLNTSKPGGVFAELRHRQLIDNLKAAPLYQFAGQALLQVEFNLTASAATQAGIIRELLGDWLSFFADAADWSKLREEYALLQQQKRQTSNALALARLDSEKLEPELSDSGVIALKAIVQQMSPTPVDNLDVVWQLPPANPFLRSAEVPAPAGLIRGQTSAHRGLRTFAQDRTRGRRERSPMQFSQGLAGDNGEAAICLRWRLDSAPPANLQPTLARSLQGLCDDASQAGVELSFSETGNQWLLKMSGRHEPMPAILEQALLCLMNPAADAWLSTESSAPLIAIRQLLKVLPAHCLGQDSQPTSPPAGADVLQQIWATARWDGLAAGLPATVQTAITRALSRVPGIPDSEMTAPASIAGQRLWSEVPSDANENALLLFCPTPTQDLADEAAWRLLAQLCQTPFYQRLRVELQLGYAVFSGVRQINGQTGLLFGVQSPNASAKEILEHIEAFLKQLPELISTLDNASLINQRQTLAEQLDGNLIPFAQAFELLWQGKLGGHSSDYLSELQQAVLLLNRTALLDTAKRLIHAAGGRRCLATNACPDGTWQPTARSLPGL
ncbi:MULTISPECIES: pyrroloquinoline quinone biosynthesis protein PqqF [unclassified Pseudomonas]|uniref:pyrroloquinoline quinone biosynthesis protein PqqF n=1 Tax=unclassified Pseudomonas TaxID=196821 RepID=UPI000CD18D6B|nr:MULTISPECIES: pyrroloquinoline quinone biosynthesis protein PqqF [unclassified Pseudomonas]POA32136.1 pyrroloquinoline quinone biosynthesis protein PqqF [Pseudomonas sp. GW456-R21]POA64732.1 pyrroloquinoline quinone biosynthesis protein PqqF [Pseudomonas sp. GW460-R15]